MQLNFPTYKFKTKREQDINYVFDIIRKKYVVLTPEEWVRQRRYARFTPSRALTATANMASGRCRLELKRLSLGGGLAVCDRRIPTATELLMELPMGLKRCRSHVLVRELRGREISFEILDIKLEDRTRLRQLLTHELEHEVTAPRHARPATS